MVFSPRDEVDLQKHLVEKAAKDMGRFPKLGTAGLRIFATTV